MLSFVQFLEEDYFSTPTLKHYSWMHHPKLGVLVHQGAYKHDDMADQYGIDKDNTLRGHFVVNKNRKRTEIKPYNWHGHKADTDHVTKELRSELKVPKSYGHLTLN
jgi:hypothetical protein